MLIRRLPRAGAAPAHESSPASVVDLERERVLDQRELELTALAAELAERGDQLDRRERKPRSKQSAARPAVLAVHRSGVTQPSDLDERARQAITTVIQRVAASQTADVAVISVPIPNEEMKGRLIGRDGRNIRSFEQLTGVSLLVDDTPGAVELSAFDPRRREVARQVLVDLISDGRVHPGRIEDSYARAEAAVAQACLAEGRAAAAEVDITDLADDVAALLGTLRYRHSYGQNVLAHLVESARLASLLAAEIGVDPAAPRRAALLHDLGKGLTDAQLPHAVAGAQFARRHGESDEVAHAIEAHHGEVEPTTIAALLVQAADAISASRPGARHEDRDLHQLRLSSLEELALAQPGVAKAYAIDAGRELRVLVEPSVLDDAAAAALAADLAERIQQQFDYPASITITVVRELRASAVAR
ncbi:MAG: HDIG domain-containing protein [Propionicimonas sp.]